jgi:hypothetical protein
MRACATILSAASVVVADRPDTNLLVSELRDFAQQVKDIQTSSSSHEDVEDFDRLAVEEEEEEGEIVSKSSLRGKKRSSYDVPTVGHAYSNRDVDDEDDVTDSESSKLSLKARRKYLGGRYAISESSG